MSSCHNDTKSSVKLYTKSSITARAQYNTPVASVKDADQAVKWYCGRWQIETFHKILKSGCTVEDCRLQNAERPQNYIAMMSVIAWRLHWMTYINRCEPHQPCTVALTTIEWQALFMRIHNSDSFTRHRAFRPSGCSLPFIQTA